jgi:hypothetical protein
MCTAVVRVDGLLCAIPRLVDLEQQVDVANVGCAARVGAADPQRACPVQRRPAGDQAVGDSLDLARRACARSALRGHEAEDLWRCDRHSRMVDAVDTGAHPNECTPKLGQVRGRAMVGPACTNRVPTSNVPSARYQAGSRPWRRAHCAAEATFFPFRRFAGPLVGAKLRDGRVIAARRREVPPRAGRGRAQVLLGPDRP